GNTDTQQEHKYEYSSVNLSTGVFTLAAMDDDGDVTTASPTQLIDTSADFTSPAVQVGMLVRNTTAGKESHVWEVTNVVGATTLDVSPIYGPGDASQDWDLNDTFQINQVITDYTTSDDAYDLILDVEASGTSVSNTFTKTLASNFGVVVNVRQGKVILPFTLNQTQGDGSTTVTVVRQPDNIAT
ncbi:MAG: hypothetical protein ACXADH_00495, partial [Candidatus Kariarchaeaceae archaeon]